MDVGQFVFGNFENVGEELKKREEDFIMDMLR